MTIIIIPNPYYLGNCHGNRSRWCQKVVWKLVLHCMKTDQHFHQDHQCLLPRICPLLLGIQASNLMKLCLNQKLHWQRKTITPPNKCKVCGNKFWYKQFYWNNLISQTSRESLTMQLIFKARANHYQDKNMVKKPEEWAIT